MHVLCVIDSLAVGGAELSLAVMAPRFVEAGVRLDVAYLRERLGLGDALRAAGAEVVSLAGPGGRLGAIGRLRRLLRARHPDLVHTTLFESDVAGRIAGSLAAVPVVSSLVSAMYGEEHVHNPSLRPWKVRAAQVVDALTARRVVRFHATSEHVAEQMSRRLRIPRERIDVVPRGRDPEQLASRWPARRAAARAALRVDPETPVVLAVGRQVYAKGLDVLLEALPLVLREHPRARLIVAGAEGAQTADLRAAVSRMRIDGRVRFLGVRQDVPELLCAADVFVLPSRREGLPGALLEAMALEAPVVATDIPPSREVLGNEGCARLVPVGHAQALGAAITATIADPEEAARRAARARGRFLERFTLERAVAGMLEFYSRALAGAAVRSTARRAAAGDAP